MCGIVGANAQRDVTPLLIEGLKRLEYRGYDSAGIAVLDHDKSIQRLRVVGKVRELELALTKNPVHGFCGIAHTRWATHGKPSEINAHPHMSHHNIALVHNGIIENHDKLRQELIESGYHLVSDTDSEVVAHLIHQQISKGSTFLDAVKQTVAKLEGAYALAIIAENEPQHIIAVRSGCPLVIGLGIGENFIASDSLALSPMTNQFIYLEEGDIAVIHQDGFQIYDKEGAKAERKIHEQHNRFDIADKGQFRHYMQKEIFEQAQAVTDTLEGRITKTRVLEQIFGDRAKQAFDKINQVQIVACGTSYHAGMVARYWIERIGGLPCQVEVASEYRYRQKVIPKGSLFVCISQSGETADTLAALRQAKEMGYESTLAICNVPDSSLVRESELVLMTRAGIEIGVASTKAFTTQLTALLLLTIVLGRRHHLQEKEEAEIVKQLIRLPELINEALKLDPAIQRLAVRFSDKSHALFLGRGSAYPIALEGALKLKEISYIHAEGYPAGELKHGPLALVDKDMPVIAVAPNDQLIEKLKSNLHEVRARGGELIVFADGQANLVNGDGITVIEMPPIPREAIPIVYAIPLQLLAYHVALIKGTDVDQPRNLAKSVTVE